jgi:hypothetical protein
MLLKESKSTEGNNEERWKKPTRDKDKQVKHEAEI